MREFGAFYGILLFGPASLALTGYLLWNARRFWPVILVYSIWYAYSWAFPFKGKMMKQQWLIRLLAPIRSYFPCRSEGELGLLDSSIPHIFVCYPHGVVAWGTLMNFALHDAAVAGLPIRALTLNANMLIPVWRECLLASGMASVNRPTISHLLGKGECSIAVVLGGAREAALTEPFKPKIILRRRKGIFELALRHGTPLVPVFTFGELEMIPCWQLPNIVANFLHGLTGFMFVLPGVPKRVPLVSVIGESIAVWKSATPSPEDVLRLQNRFEEALLTLYAANHARFNYPSALEIL